MTRFLERRLKLAVNAAKSAVARPWQRTFLGFTCTGHRPNRRRVSEKALEACKHEVRKLTSRTRGVSLGRVVGELRRYLDGWYAYCGFTEAQSSFKELDSWIRRRRRCYLWKQWGRRQYRELRWRGVSRDLAWHTVKSAHGPWRLNHSPALAIALPGRYFDRLGVPHLHRSSHRELHPPTRPIRDPYVRWCGRVEAVRPLPIPIIPLVRSYTSRWVAGKSNRGVLIQSKSW
jgi:RNA-directed DNA polymerase